MTRLAKTIYMIMFLLVLIVPLVIVIGVSLNQRRVLFFPPKGLSIKWYQELFLNPNWLDPILTSLLIASASAFVAVLLALPVAYFLRLKGVVFARYLFGFGLLPFAFPPVITAMGMLLFWVSIRYFGHAENIIIGHAVFLFALPLTMISLGMESIDREIVEASETLGATPQQTFLTVVLPIIRPFLISGFAFVFVISLNEFVISFFLGQSRIVTLPVQIFSSLRGGYSPSIASASVLFMVISITTFGLIGWFGDLPRLMGAERKS